MKALFVLARNCFQEIVREKTVAVLVFGALILVILSFFIGTLSFDEQRRILIHLGFGAIHISALGLVVFKGAYAIQREIDRQTCLMILSRPVTRFQFLMGHFVALLALLATHLFLQGIMLITLLGFQTDGVRFVMVLAGIFIEMTVILAFVLFLSQLVRPVIGLLGGIGLFLVGNWLEEMKFFAEKANDEGFRMVAHVFRWALPNLFLLNFRSENFLLNHISPPDMGTVALHFLLWITAFIWMAEISFARRDLV